MIEKIEDFIKFYNQRYGNAKPFSQGYYNLQCPFCFNENLVVYKNNPPFCFSCWKKYSLNEIFQAYKYPSVLPQQKKTTEKQEQQNLLENSLFFTGR
jgi:hypothetical protein